MSRSPTNKPKADVNPDVSPDINPVATVWLLDGRIVSDDQLLPYLSWLNPDELQRYQRFMRPERQRQFLLGRILLRFALGRLLKITPSSISFSERPGHAPLLDCGDVKPGLSLSHSGPWVACAVSEQSALGLDIEFMDAGRDLRALAEQAFNESECASLLEKNGSERVAAFYTLWSTKEAQYKLASTSGSNTLAYCINLPHADISIVLCSEKQLADVDMRIFDSL